MKSKWILVPIIALLGGVIWIFSIVGTSELSTNETTLLSIILTILSVGASWLISSIYSNISHNDNIKNYALKAAEKVNNLSNELSRLAYYLQDELENEYDSRTIDQILLIRDGKIESAVHIINTLKSMNDTSLSDWQGVIGDEIEKQKSEQRQKEIDFIEVIDKIDSLQESIERGNDSDEIESQIESKMESFAKELRILSSQVTGIPPKRKKTHDNTVVTKPCPICHEDIRIKSNKLNRKMGKLYCTKCKTNLYFVKTDNEGSLEIKNREPIIEKSSCPNCKTEISISMDPFPGRVYALQCSECKAYLKAMRTKEGVNINYSEDVSPNFSEIKEIVKNEMPSQPWPKGASKNLSIKHGIKQELIQSAINELTLEKVFKIQIDGKLYDILPVPCDNKFQITS